MQATPGLGHLDSLVDDIKRKESDRVKVSNTLSNIKWHPEEGERPRWGKKCLLVDNP